jgi:hypothetical protein
VRKNPDQVGFAVNRRRSVVALVMADRELVGRDASPTAAIIDSHGGNHRQPEYQDHH